MHLKISAEKMSAISFRPWCVKSKYDIVSLWLQSCIINSIITNIRIYTAIPSLPESKLNCYATFTKTIMFCLYWALLEGIDVSKS